MSDRGRESAAGLREGAAAVPAELADLCRAYDLGSTPLADNPSLDELLQRLLDGYEQRWRAMTQGAFAPSEEPALEQELHRLRGLVLFTRRATAIVEQAAASAQPRQQGEELTPMAADRYHHAAAGPGAYPTHEGLLARLARLDELFAKLALLSHKINNPLTSLLGRAQMLQMNRGLDPPARKAVEVIAESANHVAEHMRELTNAVREGREQVGTRLSEAEAPLGAAKPVS